MAEITIDVELDDIAWHEIEDFVTEKGFKLIPNGKSAKVKLSNHFAEMPGRSLSDEILKDEIEKMIRRALVRNSIHDLISTIEKLYP